MWPFTKRRAGEGVAPRVPDIDVRDAFARARNGGKLVDVRSAREFHHTGHPKGARSVPPELIGRGADALAEEAGLALDDELLVICLSGHRSVGQAKRLAKLGYRDVKHVHGGYLAWRRAGLPVRK
jgi:rhodanese-related sulfurtransferase